MKEKYRKFCLTFVVISILIMALVSAFNYFVDPYDMWGGGNIVGFNVYSPKAEPTDRMQKPVAFLQKKVKPEVVFIGTSQFLYALDTDVYEELTGVEAYNFSVRAASIYEQRRILEHVIANDGNLKKVYIGVVFLDFVDREYCTLPMKDKSFEANESQYGKSFVIPHNYLRNLLSLDALKESFIKILENHKNQYTNTFYMESGKIYDEHLLRHFQFNHWWFNNTAATMARNGDYRGIKLNRERVGELRRIVELCQEKNIDYHVFICPVHAMQMELAAPVWPVYEEWKRALVEIAPVMDFSGYNEMTMSPAKSGIVDEDTNPYFWDTMHMKPKVADLVMERLLGLEGNLPGFGVLLTKENIEQYLSELKSGRELWETVCPESVEESRYFSGFSNVIPRALRDVAEVNGQKNLVSVDRVGREIQVDYIDWRQQTNKLEKSISFEISLTQRNRLYIQGIRFVGLDEISNMYAVIENAEGSRYYALTRPIYSEKIHDALAAKADIVNGFMLRIPMWDVPVGEYRLFFVGVSADGAVHSSETMGTVKVTVPEKEV